MGAETPELISLVNTLKPRAGIRAWVPFVAGACLLLLAAGVFWKVQDCRFLSYDDDMYVTGNKLVKTGFSLPNLRSAWLESHAANYHPITWMSHMLDVELFGLDAPWHHRVNLILHATNTILLFWFLSVVLGASGPSFLIAALFCVHPTRVESVAWVAERKDVLSTLFGLLTLVFYHRSTIRRTPIRILLPLFFFSLSLLSKPMLVTLPFLLLLLDFRPLRSFPETEQRSPLKMLLEKLPYFLLAAAISTITVIAQDQGGAVKNLTAYPLDQRLANAVVSSCRYLTDLAWPSHLSVFYPYPKDGHSPIAISLSFVFLATVSIAAFRFAQRAPYLFVGWFWFLGTLAPVLGIVQVGDQAKADRYTYFPAIGIFLLVVLAIREMLGIGGKRRLIKTSPQLVFVGSGIVIGALSFLTTGQISHWRDTETLFQHALSVTDENDIAQTVLSSEFIRKKRFKEAEHHAREAIRINPRGVEARQNLGSALFEQKRFAEAVKALQTAIRFSPDSPWVHVLLGRTLQELEEPQAATKHFQEAIRLAPNNPGAHSELGRMAMLRGDLQGARRHFQAVTEANPRHAVAQFNLGVVCQRLGQIPEARAAFRRASDLNPSDIEAKQRLTKLLTDG